MFYYVDSLSMTVKATGTAEGIGVGTAAELRELERWGASTIANGEGVPSYLCDSAASAATFCFFNLKYSKPQTRQLLLQISDMMAGDTRAIEVGVRPRANADFFWALNIGREVVEHPHHRSKPFTLRRAGSEAGHI